MSQSHINFCYPIKRLENSRLILEPFNTGSHSEILVQGSKNHPELFDYLTRGPFQTVADFEAWHKPKIESPDTETLFAILAKGDPVSEDEAKQERRTTFAGIIGFQNAGAANASIEIGYMNKITILPAFQRTFVTSNAVGLLLVYALDLPPNGLALRRCQWQAHADNEASKRVATRMHFTFEGVQRFQRVVPADKVGNGFDTSHIPDVLGGRLGPSRDSVVFAHYCDEWPEKRAKVVAVMERRWVTWWNYD